MSMHVKKKVFSMADMQSAVSSFSPMASPVAAAVPMGMGVKVAGGMGRTQTGHGGKDCDDDDIGGPFSRELSLASTDNEEVEDEELDEDEQQRKRKQELQTPLRHTVGLGKVKKVMSALDFVTKRNDSIPDMLQFMPQRAENLLVVFDMDHTMVGDLVSLSDRDNIETNLPWPYWPKGKDRGLSPALILAHLKRGMLRPGLLELLAHLRAVGATIVVYTHSEEKWAIKVCEAMERMAGWPFIFRVFSRMDCKDGHPNFSARKSLEFVVEQLKAHDGLAWAEVENTIMFDDDGNALGKTENSRLVKVASYDYWEPCQWDEVVNEDMLSKNPVDMANMLRRSVVEWGVAPPSYITGQPTTQEEVRRDFRWAAQVRKKESILTSFNKVARLDRVMYDVLDSMMDVSDLRSLPHKVRTHLGNQVQPLTRRKPT